MQTNKDLYRQKESYAHMFFHSCLGRLIILGAVAALLLLIAHATVPSDDTMGRKIMNDIRLCIEQNTLSKNDRIDEAVRNATSIFAEPDSTADTTSVADFHKYNKLEISRHTFYSTARVRNNLKPEGIRAGIGIFGMVIPTVNYSDLILRAGPVRKEYNQPIIRNAYGSDDLGNNPDFGNTYNTYQGGGSSND